jgi:secreted trypsin-like serine protease
MKVGLITKKCVNVQKDCGVPAIKGVKVIAGKNAVRGSWPWQILLSYGGRPMCGGTIIGPQWVITASHCVYGREHKPYMFAIRAGEYDLDKKEGTEVTIKVEKVFRHENYDPHHINNDITLLKLSSPVKFTKYVMPACLPTLDPKAGTNCYITGWGKIHHPGYMHHILQQGKLPVVTNKVCNAKNWPSIGIKVTEAMICGGDGGKSRLSGCHGDSGGPFVCNVKGKWEIHGAVSHGPGNCDSRRGYSVFARVNYFKSWILNKIASN